MTDDLAGYAGDDEDDDEVDHIHSLLDMHADAAAVFLAVLRGDAAGVDAVAAGTECPGCLAITLVRLGLEFGATLFSSDACQPDGRLSDEYIRLAEQAIEGYQEGLWHQPR
jgi:hypothetical protein